jgi:hypothetical protein
MITLIQNNINIFGLNFGLNKTVKRCFMLKKKNYPSIADGSDGDNPKENFFDPGKKTCEAPKRTVIIKGDNKETDFDKIYESMSQINKNSSISNNNLNTLINDSVDRVNKLKQLVSENYTHKDEFNNFQNKVDNYINLRQVEYTNLNNRIIDFQNQCSKDIEDRYACIEEKLAINSSATKDLIAQQQAVIKEELEKFRNETLKNNDDVIKKATSNIDAIAENALSNSISRILNFIFTFGGLFDTRLIGYVSMSILFIFMITLFVRNSHNSNIVPQQIIIQTAAPNNPPSIELPIQQPLDNSTIRSELQETHGVIVKLLKLVNK